MRWKIAAAIGLILAVVALLICNRHRESAPEVGFQETEAPTRARHLRLRRPAPQLPAATLEPESADSSEATDLFGRLLAEDDSELSAERVEPYVQKCNRSLESLIGAYSATRDRAFLRDAMERFPNDSRVAFLAYQAVMFEESESAAKERRQWLEAFKQSAPDNALPNYLAARDYFRSGQADLAAQELLAAAGKTAFQDYSLDFVQDGEEAYRAAGYSEAEAKGAAVNGLGLPHLADLKVLGQNLIDWANEYRRRGDQTSAQTALQVAIALGQGLDQPSAISLIQCLVGIAIQRNALGAMDPDSPYGNAGLTVKAQLEVLTKRREELKAMAPPLQDVLQTMSDQDLVTYFDRVKLSGEEAAARWALSIYVRPAGSNQQ